MRRLILVLAAVALFAMPSAAAARVRIERVSPAVRAGSYANLTVVVSQKATCSITVFNYQSGPSHAAGLYPKTSVGGRVSWVWRVDTRTTPRRWSIDIYCGRAGSLHTSFVTT